MEYLYLIVGGFVGGIVGLTVTSMLVAGKTADLEAEVMRWKHIAEKNAQERTTMHDAEQLHSNEVRRIGKMGTRRGAITGANA